MAHLCPWLTFSNLRSLTARSLLWNFVHAYAGKYLIRAFCSYCWSITKPRIDPGTPTNIAINPIQKPHRAHHGRWTNSIIRL